MVSYASFEDFLYIIIGLVWVIFSFYNAKRKKKAKEGKPTESQKNPILDSILSEFGIDTEEDNNYEKPLQENEQISALKDNSIPQGESFSPEPEAIFSYDDIYEESNYIPPTNVIDKKQTTAFESTSTITGSKNLNLKKKVRKIDLRKAIIYSEILKKQHF